MEHVVTVNKARLDLKVLGKASSRQVVSTSLWQEERWQAEWIHHQNKGVIVIQALLPNEDLTYACKLRVKTNSEKHEEEQNGPQRGDRKLGKSIWVSNEC